MDIHVYRIVQEAVNNAVKHGRAQHVVLSQTEEPDSVSLHIDDDGVGISTQVASGHRMGLRIMRYRASMIGATLEVRRLVEGGTRITCTLPARVASLDGVSHEGNTYDHRHQ